MILRTIPKKKKKKSKENKTMYRNALIHNTSCDSQDLSLICSLFMCLVVVLFYLLVQCLLALLNLLEVKHPRWRATSPGHALILVP